MLGELVSMAARCHTWPRHCLWFGCGTLGVVTDLRTVHTSLLDPAEITAIRVLLDDAFRDGITDADLEHALGGVHAMIWEGRELIGHASVVQRRVLHDGRALRTGYVEGVGVRADRRRRGHGAAMMAVLEDVIRRAYVLGALSAGEGAAPLYAARAWRQWPGTTSVLAPSGWTRTPEEDAGIWVLPVAVDLSSGGDLACDWRDGDVW